MHIHVHCMMYVNAAVETFMSQPLKYFYVCFTGDKCCKRPGISYGFPQKDLLC